MTTESTPPSLGNRLRLPKDPSGIKARWLPSITELSSQELGFARGYQEGRKKAEADCLREMEERIQASRKHWDSVLTSMNAIPRSLIQKLREQLVQLAFDTVRKMLAATPVTREEMAAQVGQMLEHAETGSEINIQLNPQDLELLTDEDRNALWNEDFTHLKWAANPSVPRGGCLLQGEFGWIDGRRETRLRKYEQAAHNAIKDPSS